MKMTVSFESIFQEVGSGLVHCSLISISKWSKSREELSWKAQPCARVKSTTWERTGCPASCATDCICCCCNSFKSSWLSCWRPVCPHNSWIICDFVMLQVCCAWALPLRAMVITSPRPWNRHWRIFWSSPETACGWLPWWWWNQLVHSEVEKHQ